MKTAILVDGSFYRRRAQSRLGEKTAEERAQELNKYCLRHLYHHGEIVSSLYRIFYYDCLPMDKKVYHPLLQQQIDFSQSELRTWMHAFIEQLKKKRKFAVRLGKLADEQAQFLLREDVTRKLCRRTLLLNQLKEQHFMLDVNQKGVDMKIGLDIASLAYKHQVDQIILISGDSDFVPAAKLARREGIDFILDPLYNPIKPDLFEHIDGLRTCDSRFNPKWPENKHPSFDDAST
ncbi:NYN domain-containing protein [Selenomonas sp. TAMA-11512]|uniref:NYN domain-containing protein n=1 Tax=Selenomonas sp. TAMA-11512 TaxID=3095337 RepID=UPI003091A2D3|nr:NYN domain-containing protein [Selenomonas sp. TAMA-11512]